MKVLITGANGFLGHYLVAELLQKNISVIATGKGACRLPFTNNPLFTYAAMDFTDAASVEAVFEKYQPATLVHAGAMSKPDDCEADKEKAFTINVTGTANLLAAAKKLAAHFIFISTDFVFDGKQGMYKEDDTAAPVNYYGQTKWEAEQLVMQYPLGYAIVRTVLVYGKPFSGRSNILTIVKEKLEKGENYFVATDQVRTPTYVNDLAKGIATIALQKKEGIWHLSGEDVYTPYQMACAAADYLQLDKSLLKEVISATLNQPAMRPPKTGFVIEKAKRELGYQPVSFTEGLQLTFSFSD